MSLKKLEENVSGLISNVSLAIVAQLVINLSGFFITWAIARFISIEALGYYSLLNTTIVTVGVIAGGSMGVMTTRSFSDPKENAIAVLKMNFIVFAVLYFFLGIILLVFSFTISTYTKADLMLIFLLAPLLVFESNVIGSLVGLKRFKRVTYLTAVKSVLLILFILFHIKFFGVEGILRAFFCVYFFYSVFLWIDLKKFVDLKYQGASGLSFTRGEWKGYLNYFLPAILGSIMGMPVLYAISLFLASQPNGFAILGIYAIGSQLRNLLVFLSRKISEVLMPYMASSVNPEQTRLLFLKVNSLNILISVPLIVVGIVFADIFLLIVYDYKEAIARDYIFILLLSVVPAIFGSGMGSYIQAKGLMWFGFLTNIIWATLLLSITFMFINDLGILAIAYAFLVSNLINVLITIFKLKNLVDRKFVIRLFLYTFLILMMFLIRDQFFHLTIGVRVIYLALFFVLWFTPMIKNKLLIKLRN